VNAGPSVAGQNVLVTGGTRGIGRAVSLAFARQGAHVVANYVRGQQAADSLLAESEQQQALSIRICRADLTTERGLAEIDKALSALDGPLHSVVHCAATGVHKPFDDLTLRHYDWTFALNVRAFFDLIHHLLPRFASEASVVALTSHGAVRAVPNYSLIGASKAAMESLGRHLAVEFAPKGIRVNMLMPGAVATDIWDAVPDGKARLEEILKKTPQGRLVTVDEVADSAVFLCSPAARSIVGHTLVIDGGAGLPI
jgi:enoyl-[acyl-carrier protein] reductase III